MKVKGQSFRPHESKAASGRRRESRVRTSQGIVRERGAAVAGRLGRLADPARDRSGGGGRRPPWISLIIFINITMSGEWLSSRAAWAGSVPGGTILAGSGYCFPVVPNCLVDIMTATRRH